MKRHTRRLERGQSLVEMTVITVILILLLGGLVDIGRSFIILAAVENAAGEGALYGAMHPNCLVDVAATCEGNASVQDRVKQEGGSMITITNAMIATSIDGDGTIHPSNAFSVDVNYSYSPLTPIGFIIWGDTATVTATARQKILSTPKPAWAR